MKKVLFINASPKAKEESLTLQMADQFLTAYQEKNPDDVITALNLYEENIQFLNMDDINEFYTPEHLRTERKQSTLDIMKHVTQLAEADRIVIAAPMWNLASPAILKAYFDYVNIVGVTFKYTEEGAVGLLANQGKKVAYIASRGGGWSEGEMKHLEYGEYGARAQFKFFGIEEFETVLMEWSDVLQGEEREVAIATAMDNATEAGAQF